MQRVLDLQTVTQEETRLPTRQRLQMVPTRYWSMWEATPQQSDLESDFLSYIQGAGQKIVAEYAKPIHKETSFLSMKPKGTLRVGGSTSVAGMMKELADAYMKLNPNADVEVVETDSTNGLTETMDGTYDLGMSSGDLKDYEKELLESVVIAKDEIQVIVNKDNPLRNIASADLKNIYTGQIQDWKDLKVGTTDK